MTVDLCLQYYDLSLLMLSICSQPRRLGFKYFQKNCHHKKNNLDPQIQEKANYYS